MEAHLVPYRHMTPDRSNPAAVLLGVALACAQAVCQAAPPHHATHVRPSIYVTGERVEALRSVDDVRASIKAGYSKELWDEIVRRVEADLSGRAALWMDLLPNRDHPRSGGVELSA